MSTARVALSKGTVVNVHDHFSLSDGDTYSFQNTGNSTIRIGTFATDSVPDPFYGGRVGPNDDFDVDADDSDPLHAMAEGGDSELTLL